MWFEHFRVGPIQSISFTYTTSDYTSPSLPGNLVYKNNESTLVQPPFFSLDFTIASSDAVIAHVTHSGQQISIIKRDSPAAVYALDTHPFEHKLCFANAHGRLQLWDYQAKALITTLQRTHDNAVTQLRYNHNASLIAVGYADGQLTLCDALSLESILKAPFHYAKSAIQFIQFSPNSTYLATAVRTSKKRFFHFDLLVSSFRRKKISPCRSIDRTWAVLIATRFSAVTERITSRSKRCSSVRPRTTISRSSAPLVNRRWSGNLSFFLSL